MIYNNKSILTTINSFPGIDEIIENYYGNYKYISLNKLNSIKIDSAVVVNTIATANITDIFKINPTWLQNKLKHPISISTRYGGGGYGCIEVSWLIINDKYLISIPCSFERDAALLQLDFINDTTVTSISIKVNKSLKLINYNNCKFEKDKDNFPTGCVCKECDKYSKIFCKKQAL
jgi:hypothetical protein